MLKGRLDLSVFLEHILAGIHARLQGLHLGLQVAEAGHSAHGILEKRLLGEFRLRILSGRTYRGRTFDYELAMIGRKFIKHNLEECRLAAAVGSDDADTLTFVYAERNVRQDILMPVMDGYVSEIEQLYKLPAGTDVGLDKVVGLPAVQEHLVCAVPLKSARNALGDASDKHTLHHGNGMLDVGVTA